MGFVDPATAREQARRGLIQLQRKHWLMHTFMVSYQRRALSGKRMSFTEASHVMHMVDHHMAESRQAYQDSVGYQQALGMWTRKGDNHG